MNEKLLEVGDGMENELVEMTAYQKYSFPSEKGGLGGIINERDYDSVLSRLKEAEIKADAPDEHHIKQVEDMAKFAGIELSGQEATDRRVKLYSTLRSDVPPEGVKYHHNQMSDQRLFAEVLRMLEDTDSLEKLIKAYPNISFN